GWSLTLGPEPVCTVHLEEKLDENPLYAVMAALALPLQAGLTHPLKLKIDPVATANLLHRALRLPAGTVVRVESRLLTDATLEPLTLQSVNEHVNAVPDSQTPQTIPAHLYPPL